MVLLTLTLSCSPSLLSRKSMTSGASMTTAPGVITALMSTATREVIPTVVSTERHRRGITQVPKAAAAMALSPIAPRV